MKKQTLPDFIYEKKLWDGNFNIIAGIDEVGRGSFAGPVVAGCVIFKKSKTLILQTNVEINDSKKLTSSQREIASIWIKENCLTWGIGSASVSEINRLGIKKGTEIAMRRAIKNCKKQIEFILIDAFYIPYTKGLRRKNQKAIIKGDTKSISIAAASIIAKVHRDALMTKLSKNPKYKKYNWHKNKGYGTKEHRDAISKHGATRHHRKLFIRKIISP